MKLFYVASLFVGVFEAAQVSASPLSDEVIALTRDLSRVATRTAPDLSEVKLLDLKARIETMINEFESRDTTVADRLICRTSGEKAAVYNLDKSEFVDRYYGQTVETCNRIIRASAKGLICSSDDGGKTALFSLVRKSFVDRYYGKTVDDCIRTIEATRNDLTCATDGSGINSAVYDLRNDVFVDQFYSKSLDTCLQSL